MENDVWRDVFVILPTLNEEQGLKLVLDDLKKINFPMSNVIVLDGHSKDRTLEIAKRYGTKIIMQKGKGKGMAFQTFLEEFPINDDAIYVMLDADYSYNPLELEKFVKAVKEGYDVVAGRRTPVIYSAKALVHIIGGFMISISAALLYFKLNLDVCTGYWAFRGSALKKMKITADRFQLEANLFIEVCKHKLKFKTFKISYRERKGSKKLRSIDGFHILWFILRQRF